MCITTPPRRWWTTQQLKSKNDVLILLPSVYIMMIQYYLTCTLRSACKIIVVVRVLSYLYGGIIILLSAVSRSHPYQISVPCQSHLYNITVTYIIMINLKKTLVLLYTYVYHYVYPSRYFGLIVIIAIISRPASLYIIRASTAVVWL